MFSIAPRVVKRHLQQFVGGSGQIPSGPAYSPVTHTPVAVQSRRAPLRRYLHAASVAAPALHEQPVSRSLNMLGEGLDVSFPAR